MEEEKTYSLLRVFRSSEDAQFFVEIFDNSGIDYKLEQVQSSSDNIITDSFNAKDDALGYECMLLVCDSDIEKAQIVLRKHLSEYFSNGNNEENTLLNDFTDDELEDVLRKPDEWNVEDQVLAQAILNKRGKIVSDEQVEQYRNQRLDILRKPKFVGVVSIIVCYIFSILGGLIGLIIGISFIGKKKLFNGEKVAIYDNRSRLHAKVSMIIAVLVMLGIVVYFMIM